MLSGNHIQLIRPSLNDWQQVKAIWEDPATMKEVGGIHPLPKDRYEQWFQRMLIDGKEEHDYYLIYEIKDNQCVGEVSFHCYNHETKTAMFNIKVKHAHRGNGYATEAMDLIFDYYFNVWQGEIMEDSIALNNTVGLQRLTKYGFKEVKRDHEAVWVELKRQDWKMMKVGP